MTIQALHERGYLDISTISSDIFVGPPLRLALSPGQTIEISDNYSGIAAINNAISMGLLRLVSYSNSSSGYVGVPQVQKLIEDNDVSDVALINAHSGSSSNVHGISGNVVGTSGAQTLTAKTITNYGEGVGVLGNISGSRSLDLSIANVFTATITEETTFTFTNPRASGISTSFILILTNGGDYTVNWPNSVYWPGGEAPVLTASSMDILTFITTDGGIIWHGIMAQSNSAPVLVD